MGVIPAKAGIQFWIRVNMDSLVRGVGEQS